MTAARQMKAGDFTQLAKQYVRFRPGYSEQVLRALLGVVGKPASQIDYVDVGAGTGILTRQMHGHGCKSVKAVEPNAAMRSAGMGDFPEIEWIAGSAEVTGLPDNSADVVSMASSFHWADFEVATKEFHRILRDNGHFFIVWNPRFIDSNPLLVEIENQIIALNPDVKRVSSGRSKHVDQLAARLGECELFKDMIYIESKDTVELTREHYIGAWKSVNDVRSQLGEEKFAQFISFVEDKVKDLPVIPCEYQTRAWMVNKK